MKKGKLEEVCKNAKEKVLQNEYLDKPVISPTSGKVLYTDDDIRYDTPWGDARDWM